MANLPDSLEQKLPKFRIEVAVNYYRAKNGIMGQKEDFFFFSKRVTSLASFMEAFKKKLRNEFNVEDGDSCELTVNNLISDEDDVENTYPYKYDLEHFILTNGSQRLIMNFKNKILIIQRTDWEKVGEVRAKRGDEKPEITTGYFFFVRYQHILNKLPEDKLALIEEETLRVSRGHEKFIVAMGNRWNSVDVHSDDFLEDYFPKSWRIVSDEITRIEVENFAPSQSAKSSASETSEWMNLMVGYAIRIKDAKKREDWVKKTLTEEIGKVVLTRANEIVRERKMKSWREKFPNGIFDDKDDDNNE